MQDQRIEVDGYVYINPKQEKEDVRYRRSVNSPAGANLASLFDINPNARFSFASILFGDPVSPNLQSSPSFQRHDLVTSAAGLGDDAGELLNLRLGAGEGSEALLGELTGTLVLGVAEEFNDAALIGSEAVRGHKRLAHLSHIHHGRSRI